MAVVLLLYLIAEIAAIWAVASAVGALWTVLLLLGGAFVGSWLARREGGKVARELFTATREGRSGHREITDGMLVALGGLLILLPGFLTDIAGFLVMLPPARGYLRKQWLRKMERAGSASTFRYRHRTVVDGEVVDESWDDNEGPGPDGPRTINP
ncbi:UPF0716 protein FxsA [Haloechinothrix alba]|uniref:UPF0716 protein FxsA n=1 Tax=Haloechinothrix alba TaxID=664784 RepID=A0A238UYV3_9PSEU|nr:FxsA family protein [Haloechinothrix alba]SNR27178.1 UPF0716 protein FxsA [Haloechinothrix alba]